MMKRSMDALIRVFRSGSPTRWKIFRFRGTECSGDVINREGAVALKNAAPPEQHNLIIWGKMLKSAALGIGSSF